jgi:allantoate deiminase
MTTPSPSQAASKVVRRLEALFAIGAAEGANRPGLSLAEQQAHDLTAGWMTEAGLVVAADGAGNLIGRSPGSDPLLPEVWTGSHLDTVPNGGRFDGALGVVAGLAAVAAASRAPHARTIAVVAFRDEEGWRFGRGFFGSRALCGQLAAGELEARDAGGTSIADALTELGLPAPGMAGGKLPGAFVELHIEQGNTLAERGLAIGVVSEIVAMAGMTVRFLGERAHAGGAAMTERRDGLVAAARFVLAAHSLARSDARWRATAGELIVSDPAPNVIARDVAVSVDARARSDESLDSLLGELRDAAADAARQSGCDWESRLAWRAPAVTMSPSVTDALAAAAGHRAVSEIGATSWAGHDAGILAAAGVPAGLLFVRAGRAGLSHSPYEAVDTPDIAVAIETLARVLAVLADSA